MKFGASRVIVFGAAAALLVLSSCKSEDEYKKERIVNAHEQFEAARKRDLPADKVLTVQDCIELAMKHNLDIKVQNIEKDAAKNIMWAEILGMLPDLTVGDRSRCICCCWTIPPRGCRPRLTRRSPGCRRLRR